MHKKVLAIIVLVVVDVRLCSALCNASNALHVPLWKAGLRHYAETEHACYIAWSHHARKSM